MTPENTSEKPKAMLVNVGGATAPAVHALNEQQPPFVCFFVSADSRPLINKILPALNYRLKHFDWIETPSPQDLVACYRVLARDLPGILRKWEVEPNELAVEYTAGTKPMSVAAVLATIDSSSQYFYVGSKDPQGRDKGGIGVVLDGREWTWFQSNPWTELAVKARQEIAFLFNHGSFTDAYERARRLSTVVPPDMRDVYRALADLIEGYALWDRFEYKKAQQKIFSSLQKLKLFVAGRPDPLRPVLDIVEQNAEFLRKHNKKGEEAQRLDVLDLIANAIRRAEVARKYDDAVARLYSALEALSRNRLLNQYQIKTSAVLPSQIPDEIREQFVRLYSDPEHPEAGLRLGLKASYRLLESLGDELGAKYKAHETELNKVLRARNQSRLAHGTEPIKPETYQKMRDIVLAFAEVKEDDLPHFPRLEL